MNPLRTTLPALAAALLALAAPVRANAPPGPSDHRHGYIAPGWYLPVGLFAGGSLPLGSDREESFLLGLEASAVYLFDVVWAGAFADARWVTGPGEGRYALGLEAGWAFVGAELALSTEVREDTVEVGFRVGAVLTLAFVALVGRWQHLVDAVEPDALELGLLFKVPIAL